MSAEAGHAVVGQPVAGQVGVLARRPLVELHLVVARARHPRPLGMLPVIIWQDWETLGGARDHDDSDQTPTKLTEDLIAALPLPWLELSGSDLTLRVERPVARPRPAQGSRGADRDRCWWTGGTMSQEQVPTQSARFERWFEVEVVQPMADFQDPSQEWRRLFSELLGTFFLVLVAAGGGMLGQAFPNTISRGAAVTAPGLMVMAIILFMGKVSGAHLNPAVSLAFSLRGDFPWRRVPGYIVAQLAGATLAALFLRSVVGVSATFGSNYPAAGYSSFDAYLMEAVLTLGLVSVILGTASGAQNLGVIGALGVGAYIILAGLWGSPISGASMNPARTFGPDLVGTNFTDYWVYVAGPLTGAAIAVGFAFLLRGYGGGRSGSAAAQGALDTEVKRPPQP